LELLLIVKHKPYNHTRSLISYLTLRKSWSKGTLRRKKDKRIRNVVIAVAVKEKAMEKRKRKKRSRKK
jgi:hypothetical protein